MLTYDDRMTYVNQLDSKVFAKKGEGEEKEKTEKSKQKKEKKQTSKSDANNPETATSTD